MSCSPIVIDALFQRCTEGEGRVTKAVKGAGRVLTPPVLTVRGVLALIHISLLLRSHTTVAVSGQGPGWRADAVIGARGVHAAAIFTVFWVLTLIHICYCYHYALFPVGVWDPGLIAVAVEGPFSVDAPAISTHRLIMTFVHINALKEVAIVVEALLTVALVAWKRVLTATFLTDFFSKQGTLINILVGWEVVLETLFIVETLPIWTKVVELG